MSQVMSENTKAMIEQKVIQATELIEQQVDETLAQLEELKTDDLEELRQRRLKQMKEEIKLKQQWKNNGHGEYYELKEEKELFTIFKKSSNVVVHFYRANVSRCKIVDHHFNILAKQHLETRFCKILADNAMFFAEKLGIRVIPTIALIKNGKVLDYIVGFTELGNCDDFKTEMLEWRLAVSKVIEYNGDLSQPPNPAESSTRYMKQVKKTIRGYEDDNSDSD